MNQINLYIIAFCSLFLAGAASPLSGCQQRANAGEPASPEVQKTYLIKAEKIGQYKPEQISGRFTRIPQVGLLTQHSVAAYRITYRTTHTNGSEIEASGALLIPVTDKPLPVLSQQHGTINSDHSAPSNYGQGTEVWSFGTVLASTGYVVAAPDYIGYGASKNLPHPYQHAASLASASVDMLRASKEFCQKQKVSLNGQLFLAGYSEGGFATMALHKKLEEDHAREFTVTASAPGAGAYHTSAFAKHVLQAQKPLNFINTYLWVLDTYNSVYKLNSSYSFYLNEPYATQAASNGKGGISGSVNPQRIFTRQFREGVLNGTNHAFINALHDNDIHNWAPKAPVALFHGTDDDYVPFFNSQDAYNAMKANGAANVELRPIQGGDHFTSIAQYSVGLLFYFGSFAEDSVEQ